MGAYVVKTFRNGMPCYKQPHDERGKHPRQQFSFGKTLEKVQRKLDECVRLVRSRLLSLFEKFHLKLKLMRGNILNYITQSI